MNVYILVYLTYIVCNLVSDSNKKEVETCIFAFEEYIFIIQTLKIKNFQYIKNFFTARHCDIFIF